MSANGILVMMADFTSFFKGLIPGSGPTSVAGVDIGASSIKIVQLRASRGMAILETYGEIALGPYGEQSIGKVVKVSPEKIAEALADLMREANVTAHEVAISIPFASSLIEVIDLPKVDNESLKRIIPIEARKYIPIPISEVSLDWSVIPSDEGQDSAFDRLQNTSNPKVRQEQVLLVAIHNDALQNFKTIANTVGLSVDFYEIEIFSAIRSSLEHGLVPVLLVDFGASTTKMYVVERGIVRLTHLVTIGGQQETENLARSMGWDFERAERVKRERGLVDSTAYSQKENDDIKEALLSTLSRLFGEVNRVLLSYGQRYNKNISRVVFAGGGASLPGLLDAARTALNTEVVIAAPFEHTQAPAFLDEILNSIGPGFAVSVGLALRKLQSK